MRDPGTLVGALGTAFPTTPPRDLYTREGLFLDVSDPDYFPAKVSRLFVNILLIQLPPVVKSSGTYKNVSKFAG